MIDRKRLVARHNPELTKIDLESPLTVGNGEFAYTVDVTGLQSFYDAYLEANAPLCTMSQWGWHTEPPAGGRTGYTLDDVDMTRYDCGGRISNYAVQCKQGNETVYHWLRHNPHKMNLARIAFRWLGGEIRLDDIEDIHQKLDLFTGVLHSGFVIGGNAVQVKTLCAQNADVVGFSIQSRALGDGRLTVMISFPYGSHNISGSDWQSEGRHTTELTQDDGGQILIKRTLDYDHYFVSITGNVHVSRVDAHTFQLAVDGDSLDFTVAFSQKDFMEKNKPQWDFDRAYKDCTEGWARFWYGSGAADFSRSKDLRAKELERRIVLSQYLTAIHCAGSIPPQETGLACNSWYGKFHLEMHIIHSGQFPLWGNGALLEKSLPWYLDHMDQAKANAAHNGYAGARIPKMIGPEGIDSPSPIATLLIWQQPHILYMLEILRLSKPAAEKLDFMRKYWEIVRETANFMSDFPRWNNETQRYDLAPPLIPAQEEHTPEMTVNPVFELCYWQFGLEIAINWAEELHEDATRWKIVKDHLAPLPVINGLYPAHENCPDTFSRFNQDHPSMLYGLGFIPCDHADQSIMADTFDKVRDCWDFNSLWGWDFAFMAMTMTRLGRPDDAVDILLMDTVKNSYVTSGNNYQRSRADLPLYLPGNGSLLLAVAMMLAGYGQKRDMPGFPHNGMWDIVYEGILPLPY